MAPEPLSRSRSSIVRLLISASTSPYVATESTRLFWSCFEFEYVHRPTLRSLTEEKSRGFHHGVQQVPIKLPDDDTSTWRRVFRASDRRPKRLTTQK